MKTTLNKNSKVLFIKICQTLMAFSGQCLSQKIWGNNSKDRQKFKGNLTDLKKRGLVRTSFCGEFTYIELTKKGKELEIILTTN